MTRYHIGIDTGGTYTDAVLIDVDGREVIAAAKSITTHSNLVEGVRQSLQTVLQRTPHIAPAQIAQVSLSTTLATNALVEGQGSKTAVVLIGFDDGMTARTNIATAIPDAHVIRIRGGHTYEGHESEPLDIDALKYQLSLAQANVDAFAIAAHYAVRNPSHERQAQDVIERTCNKPVSASCALSDSLNGPLRALTAAFNARIIALIVDLENAVATAVDALGISAPIMLVKGDGSIASAASVLSRPIETILSGPAASVIGARFLTGLNDFVIADIGGTTTDVATVTGGWPGLSDRGADVGGFHTLVKAIDMRTIGLGGDSAVEINELHNIVLSSSRVIPIAMLAQRFPAIRLQLDAARKADSGMRSALHYLVPSSTSILQGDMGRYVSAREREFLARFDHAVPRLYHDIVLGAADRSTAKGLLKRGILQASGFTPSDAAHVLDLQSQWCQTSAHHACELLGRAGGLVSGAHAVSQTVSLARAVIDAVIAKSTRLMICELGGMPFFGDDILLTAACERRTGVGNLNVALTSALPVVAVGGPARVYYPAVGERLGVSTVIPQHSEVANAIGAAVGLVRAERTVEVTLAANGGFAVHHAGTPVHVATAVAAIEQATALARAEVLKDLQDKGGQPADVSIQEETILIPDTTLETGLISARITAVCDSTPKALTADN